MSWIHAIYAFFCEILLGCSHGRLTRPFTIEAESYKVCLDCGRQFPYSVELMRTMHPWEVRKLRAQVAELTPVTELSAVSISTGYAETEDYEGTRAIA